MDDRSLKTLDEAGTEEDLQAALEATAAFDSAVGLQESVAKRQEWEEQQSVEQQWDRHHYRLWDKLGPRQFSGPQS